MPYAAESVLFTAAREAKKIWPALAGFGVVGFAVVKVTAGATPEARAATLLRRRAAAALAPPVCGALHGIAAGCAARCVARILGFCERGAPFPARKPLSLTVTAPVYVFAGHQGVQVHQPEPGPLSAPAVPLFKTASLR
jgi:hypothetical protein